MTKRDRAHLVESESTQMNVCVMLISLAFVFAGWFLIWNGRDPAVAWMTTAFFGGCLVIATWDLMQTRPRGSLARINRFDPNDSFLPIVVKRSVGHFFAYMVGSGCFVCTGTLMILSDKAPILGWATVAFFGLGTIVLLVQVVDPRPRLLIDEEGVFDRTLGVGPILWSDIEGAYVVSVHGLDFICLVVRDPSVYLEKLSPLRRKLASANCALGFMELNLNLAGLKMSTQDLLRLIGERIEEHKPG
jgi:hypothetical protein